MKQGSCNASFGKIHEETNTEQMLRMDEKKFRKVKLSTLAKQSNQLCCSFKIGLACICRILMNKIISQSRVIWESERDEVILTQAETKLLYAIVALLRY